MTKLYTVAHRNGEYREYNLTLREAAQMILHHDGGEYEIRPAEEPFKIRNEIHWALWTRNSWNPWFQRFYYSYETNYESAEADIFGQVVDRSRRANWPGPVAEEQGSFLDKLAVDCQHTNPNPNPDTSTFTVTGRERDTILAALRYWQREGILDQNSYSYEWAIATNGREGDDAALLIDEIDELCERINT